MKKNKSYKSAKSKPYKLKNDIVYSGLGNIPTGFIPEIKVRYNRGKKFLGKVTKSTDVADFVRKIFGRGQIQLQEVFIVLYLNHQNEIIGYYKHSVGTINSAIIDVRLVFATALASLATSMVLAHNHPSGSLKPSEADLKITDKIIDAGKLLDIKVLDHVILTKSSYYSFADEDMF